MPHGSLTYAGVSMQQDLEGCTQRMLDALNNGPGLKWQSRHQCLGVAVANLELTHHEMRGAWNDPTTLVGWMGSLGSDGGVQEANAARMLRPAARTLKHTWDLVALGNDFKWDNPVQDVAGLSPWGDYPHEGAVHSFDGRHYCSLVAVSGLSPHQNNLLAHALADLLRSRKAEITRG